MTEQGAPESHGRSPVGRRWWRWAVTALLVLAVGAVAAYVERARIGFWLGHHEVLLSGARLEGNKFIKVHHTGLQKELAADEVCRIVVRGPQNIGLWDRNQVPSVATIRAAPKEIWLTKILKPEEVRGPGEVVIEFPMTFAVSVSGMLDCYLERAPRPAEDERQPGLAIALRFITEQESQPISNVVAFP